MSNQSHCDEGLLVDLVANSFSVEGNASKRLRYLLQNLLSRVASNSQVLRVVAYDGERPFQDPTATFKCDTVSEELGVAPGWNEYNPAALAALQPIIQAVQQRVVSSPTRSFDTHASDLLKESGQAASDYIERFLHQYGFNDAWSTTLVTQGTRTIALVVPEEGGRDSLSDRQRATLSTSARVIGRAYLAETDRIQRATDSLRAEHDLSPLQTSVLRGVLEGMTERQIAMKIDRSERTVNGRLREVYRRLRVSGRAELLVSRYDDLIDADPLPSRTPAGESHD